MIVTAVIAPFSSTVVSTVNPVPDPAEVVATPVPAEYPVPAVVIEPRVLAPDPLAFTIVTTSDAA